MNKAMNVEIETAINLIWDVVQQARDEFYGSDDFKAEHKEIGQAMSLIESTLSNLYHQNGDK